MSTPRIVSPRAIGTKELVDQFAQSKEAARAARLRMDGQIALGTGDKEKGVKLLSEAAKLLADDREAQHEIAMAAHQADAHVLAFETAARAFELGNEQLDALIAAANASYAARWEDAIRYADALLKLDDDRNGHIVRGVSLTELRKFDEAIAACDRALALEDDAMVTNCKAFALAAAGREKEAKQLYTRALGMLDSELESSPDDADVHSRRAYTLIGLGRYKDAIAAAKKALSIEPERFLTLQSLGRALVLSGKPKEALKPLLKAIKSRHAAPMSAHYAALAYEALGDAANAKKMRAAAAASPLFAPVVKKKPATKKKATTKKKAATPKKK